jgi:hypothetical protein
MSELNPMSISKDTHNYYPMYGAQIVSTGTLYYILLHFAVATSVIIPVLGAYTIFGGSLIYTVIQENNQQNELILPKSSGLRPHYEVDLVVGPKET